MTEPTDTQMMDWLEKNYHVWEPGPKALYHIKQNRKGFTQLGDNFRDCIRKAMEKEHE